MGRQRARNRARPLSGIFAADTQVFRFYPDGTVLDVLVRPAPSRGDGETIARRLHRDNPLRGVHAVPYEQHGKTIGFTTRGHPRDDAITVRGTWSHGRLVLNPAGQGWQTGPQLFARATAAGRPRNRPPPPAGPGADEAGWCCPGRTSTPGTAPRYQAGAAVWSSTCT